MALPGPTPGRCATGASRARRSCSRSRPPDGDRLWVEAGERVRHLTLGDRVELRLRAVETVAFGRHGHDAALVHRSHAPSVPEPAPGMPTAT